MSTFENIENEIQEIKEANADWKNNREVQQLITALINKQTSLINQQGMYVCKIHFH